MKVLVTIDTTKVSITDLYFRGVLRVPLSTARHSHPWEGNLAMAFLESSLKCFSVGKSGICVVEGNEQIL